MDKRFLVELDIASNILKLSQEDILNIVNSNNLLLKEYHDESLVNLREINKLVKLKKIKYNFTKVNKIYSQEIQTQIKKYTGNGLKAIDLFCGAGGSSRGFKMAGFNILGAIDVNKVAAETHKLNFPETKTVCEDIQIFTPDKMEELIGTREVDVVFGSPPCQTFSSLSHGKINSLGRDINKDIRNYYYKFFIDYVVHFNPKIFVMENVPGFKTKYNGAIFNDLVQFFKEYNNGQYILKDAYLQSEEHGVPQKRRRLFVVGYRKDLKFSFPEPTHTNNLLGLPYVTVKQAISDLPHITDDWRIDEMPYSEYRGLHQYQLSMRGSNKFVKNNICRVSNENAKKMFKHLLPGMRYLDIENSIRENLDFMKSFNSGIIASRCRRLPLKEPSWTVIAHIGMDGYEYIHPSETRTLSVREAARLQSFPDDFVFLGNMREQYVQIGNAVPPLLAYVVAKNVERAIKEI